MSYNISISKMHVLGNDFIIIDNRRKLYDLNKEMITFLADRRLCIGCDQVIIISHTTSADCYINIYNQDGLESAMCGNAIQCVAYIIAKERNKSDIRIQTKSFTHICKIDPYNHKKVQITMPLPSFNAKDIPLKNDNIKHDQLPIHEIANLPHTALNIGNPHVVVFVNDLLKINFKTMGKLIENHLIFPKRTNIEFAQILNDSSIKVMVWERGVGKTLSCGSGACATLIAAIHLSLIKNNHANIIFTHGQLHVQWNKQPSSLLLQGELSYIFSTDIQIPCTLTNYTL